MELLSYYEAYRKIFINNSVKYAARGKALEHAIKLNEGVIPS
jgi:hypothetical protein